MSRSVGSVRHASPPTRRATPSREFRPCVDVEGESALVRAVPQLALDFLQKAEACRLDAYQDSAGVWTICYGHTGADVVMGLCINRPRARRWLAEDAQQAAESLAWRLHPGGASE